MSVDYSEIDDEVMSAFEQISDDFGVPVTQILDNLPEVGVDPTEITADQAKRMKKAVDDGDVDEYEAVLKDIGVPESFRSQIIEMVNERAGEEGGDVADAVRDATEGVTDDAPDETGSDDDTLTRSEVRKMIRREVPDASSIASELEKKIGGGGGGGQQAQAAPAPAENSQQRQAAIELAKMWIKKEQGGGQMASVAQQAQENMMQAFAQQAKHMAQPSLGQKIGEQIDQKVANQKADEIVSEMFGDGESLIDAEGGESKETAADGGEESDDDQ